MPAITNPLSIKRNEGETITCQDLKNIGAVCGLCILSAHFNFLETFLFSFSSELDTRRKSQPYILISVGSI